MSRSWAGWLLAIALLAPAPAGARVFWQWGTGGGGSSRGVLDPQEAAWSRAYTAPLRINGGRAEVSVWGTAQTVEEILAALRQRITDRGGAIYFAAGDELAWGLAWVEGEVLRFVVSAGPGRYGHVVQIAQSFADYRASRTAPVTAGLPDVPELPAARVSQVLANEATGLSVATAHTAASPGEVTQQANQLLAGAGWSLLLPAGGQAGVFTRNRDLLVMSALSAGRDGGTVVTLAHKRRAMEEAR